VPTVRGVRVLVYKSTIRVIKTSYPVAGKATKRY